MKVHEAIARAVAEEDTGSAFTLMGNANMEILGSLLEVGGPRQYQARFEGAAVTMAEGYARSTGRLGLASITAGPGLSNATNALACASRNAVPMVVVTGHPGSRSNQQYLHQEALAELVGAGYFDVTSAANALDAVHDAFYAARTERRPVLLDVPRPVTMADFPWPYDYAPSHKDIAEPRRLPPDPATVGSALDLIAASERPVILAGRGALSSGARQDILDLATEIGALLSTSLPVKNWFAGDPFDIGVSGLFCARYTGEFAADADVVIAIGASLNTHTTQGGYMFPEAHVIQVDTRQQVVMGNGRRADCLVNGDAQETARVLLDGVRARSIGAPRYRTEEVRAGIARGKADADPAVFEIEPDLADGRRLINAVDDVFPSDSSMVISNGHCWGITIPEFKKWRSPQLYSGAFGSIGMALPTAVGAAVGNPGRPVLHIEGDGGVMMNLHTLDTVVQYDLPVFTVVMNDASFSAEEHQMRKEKLDPTLAHQHPVDFAAVAAALGARSAVVRTGQEMRKAAEEFLAAPGPYVVDARISRNVVSVPFRRLHYGIEA